MVLVPLRKQFRELYLKNIPIKNENIITLQNYMESLVNDPLKKSEREVPVGICDTMSEKLGIKKIGFFLDGNGNTFIEELTQNGNNLIQFSSIDKVAEYIDYITKLGIYCKLYDKQISIMRENGERREISISTNYGDFFKQGENFEDFMMQNKEKLQNRESTFFANNSFLLNSREGKQNPISLEELTNLIKDKFRNMDSEDITKSQLSQYEYRKIIGMMYEQLDLNQEEIEALNKYKHANFTVINGFLRGDLKSITDMFGKQIPEEKFVTNYLDEVIDNIGTIANLQKKFASTRDLTLIRRDSRANENMENKLEYDNFVSTSANPRLFTYNLDGIGSGGFIFIKVPKGTPLIPMDIVTEKRMSLDESVNPMGGGDLGYEESELLMPMCELNIDNSFQAQNGLTMANATLVRQKNPIAIMEQRLYEIKDIIIQYAGNQRYEELKNKVEEFKIQQLSSQGKEKFSEQEIGKSTIEISIEKKDMAQSKIIANQQEQNQEQAVLK